MEEKKWRFPSNNGGSILGLTDTSKEFFKQNPLSSLTREILQNSIDAIDDNTKAVKVDFNLFEISKESDFLKGLKEEVLNCLSYVNKTKSLANYSDELNEMIKILNQNKISCLRISDFNTVGLKGIKTNMNYDISPWQALVKAQGISNKDNQNSGGTKGIGKNAVFSIAKLNTVFYSTNSKNDQTVGYEGVSRLMSAPIKDTDELTQGIGYFSSNDKNDQIVGEIIDLDKDFNRNDNFGTDIFILGFLNFENWENEVLNSVLSDFMYAVYKNKLEVSINGQNEKINISSKTVRNLSLNEKNKNDKKLRESIFLQYLTYDHEAADENGFKSFEDQNDDLTIFTLSTKSSITIDYDIPNIITILRYPYMKIKDFKNKINNTNSSMAICVIEAKEEKGILNILRRYENASHNDWNIDSITDRTIKNKVNQTIKKIQEIVNKVVDVNFPEDNSTRTELVGADNVLSANKNEIYEIEYNKKVKENTSINKITIKNDSNLKNNTSSEAKHSSDSVVGKFISEGDNTIANVGVTIPKTKKPNVDDFNNQGNVESNEEGKTMSNVDSFLDDYDFIATDYKKGEYILSFVSDRDNENAFLSLKLIDSEGKAEDIEILKAWKIQKNRIELTIKENKILISIKADEKQTILLKTNENDMFSSEVILNA